ncbi:hypothetical protein IQ274_23810 [Nostoc sp. LEGE 12447]|uniref:hypothetical protein n=1 Tax=Nostoc sp. LEGE 12447 TaxID=1828640 RepID=UPI0018843E58|nr:hypothetical protein [Nostoc sp. LEGE 12447]MBE9001162.1 hypothetical protein [Nostoc sp. LEGE 12447]
MLSQSTTPYNIKYPKVLTKAELYHQTNLTAKYCAGSVDRVVKFDWRSQLQA